MSRAWQNLRVLAVSRRLYPPNGGGEISLLETLRHLAQAGAQVELLYHGEDAAPGFVTYPLAVRGEALGMGMWTRQALNYRAWLGSIRQHLRRAQPDVLITQQETAAAAVEAARAEGIRSIVFIRGTDYLELPGRGAPGAWRHYLQAPVFWQARRQYLRSLRRADSLVANSDFIRKVYEPLVEREMAVVYPPVKDCAAGAAPRNRIDGHFLMLSPHAHKGGHIVLAMARLMPEAKFVVAGNGEAEIVNRLRTLPNVDYRGWIRDPQQLFAGACATLIPTQMPEAFGRVAIESMGHGVPVIASNSGGLPEALGEAGILPADWKRPEAWAAAARALRADPARYQERSVASLAHARRFDAGAQMRNFCAVLRRTLESPRRARCAVAGIAVDPLTLDQASREIERACREGRRIQVATVNSEFVVQAQQDRVFRQALDGSALAVPDSFGITLALRLRGLRMGRCPGVELSERLAALSASSGLRLFLLGSTGEVLDAAVRMLRARYPGSSFATYAPPFGDLEGEESEKIIAEVNRFGPDILLVAFGAPRQEVWIARHLARLQVHVAIGVGGSFDMISGRLERCPPLIGRYGLEWAYRLSLEPARWRRCLRLIQFLPLAFSQRRVNPTREAANREATNHAAL